MWILIKTFLESYIKPILVIGVPLGMFIVGYYQGDKSDNEKWQAANDKSVITAQQVNITGIKQFNNKIGDAINEYYKRMLTIDASDSVQQVTSHNPSISTPTSGGGDVTACNAKLKSLTKAFEKRGIQILLDQEVIKQDRITINGSYP